MTTWQAVACATGMLLAYVVEQNLPQAPPGMDPVALVQSSSGSDVGTATAGWLEPVSVRQALTESEDGMAGLFQSADDGARPQDAATADTQPRPSAAGSNADAPQPAPVGQAD